MPERAVGQKRVGIPSTRPSGSRRSLPRAQTEAPRAAIGDEGVPDADLAAEVAASGRRPRKPSGPRSTAARRTLVRRAPPSRSEDSRTTTSACRPRLGSAGQLPGGGQAADTTADDDHPTAPPCQSAPSAVDHDPGQHPDEGGIVVQRRGAGVGDPDRGGHGGQLDVEVVEHLEMVGHEADRAHHHGVDRPRRPASRRTTSRTSGRARARGAARALPGHRPVVEPGGRRPPAGRTRPTARGRCRRSPDPLGEGVGGEDHAGAARATAARRADVPARSRRVPVRRTRADGCEAASRPRRRRPARGTRRAHGRRVGGEHETDHLVDARRRPARPPPPR